ncbi:nitrogenase cofactor biosynthesis protein NifB [Azospirillum thermophilum]|uniref:FeMo cofactor biosynthesis protein NifB n=1 Tax=Azospirillum thermophilum TaxID=2202148 RepID=A0A2S2CQH8_9PROT|nr:nitrogenase cofactor biosynthesis protein NifB [Azospirillum thermophilum]AWK86783.1 nitrogenase cofactor biosynthesis protein NifB [Azospirillum thermophilum]
MDNVISLDGILGLGELKAPDTAPPASAASGCSSSSCGSSDGPADMAPEVWEKVKNHPCYSEEAHHYFARMHVAVAPACNIQCNYCNRKYDCSNESRPGVVSEKLTPDQAIRKILAVAKEIPQLSVIGIAGPGDSLAAGGRNTFATFEQLQKKAPDLKLCLSTNGLALPDHVERIAQYNIDHVTITINMVDPEVGQHIYPWIFHGHRRWTGLDAAKILHERQMLGLEMLTARGILVKVNSVMIPGINDEHLLEVNRQVKARGAFLHNIMPLISDPAHGTQFGLTGQRGPTAQELKVVQDACEGGAKLMRHCRQCRADAVGLLGEDRGAEFTIDRIEAMGEVDYDDEARRSYREHVEAERAGRAVSKAAAKAEVQDSVGAQAAPILIAVATKGGERINEHFGHAREFQIYEVGPQGATFVGHRRVDQYCEGGSGDEDALDGVLAAINDCTAVLVAKIGGCPSKSLQAAGIEPVDRFAFEYIEESALAYFKDYAGRLSRGAVSVRAGQDAVIRTGALTALRA